MLYFKWIKLNMEKESLDFTGLKDLKTYKGHSLFEISFERPVLLVFLRHFGCTFCREALHDLKDNRRTIESEGTQIILVHLSDDETALKYFKDYGLSDIDFITDPDAIYYRTFGLVKGTFNQLFGLRTWMRTVQSAVINQHGWGKTIGDGFQMPGVFIVHKGQIISSFIHRLISDRPDYLDLVKCCRL
jgi:peroxiredoxin